jgi:hypothetical protein
MQSDDRQSAKEFIARMDSGDFDGAFSAELQNLSSALLKDIVVILRRRRTPLNRSKATGSEPLR